MKVTVFVDDVGCTVEDDEPFDDERASRIMRIVGAGVIQVYESSILNGEDPE